jgi:hypothetical protein
MMTHSLSISFLLCQSSYNKLLSLASHFIIRLYEKQKKLEVTKFSFILTPMS